ncbi:MAG: N-acetyltransferase family protein [Roseibium sp.]
MTIVLEVRNAKRTDVPEVTKIFNQAVELPSAVWRDAPAEEREVIEWFKTKHSFIIAEGSKGVVGFGSLGPFKPTLGFERTAEISVYVKTSAQGHGVGTALVERLIQPKPGLASVIASIDSENAGSLVLHRKLGFQDAGFFYNIGTKSGESRDLYMLQRTI